MPENIDNATPVAVRKINKALVTEVAIHIGGTLALTTASLLIANRIEKAIDNRRSN